VRTLEETSGAAAVMSLVVLPWGEVYLDGRMQGVSPPLIELQVAPGRHEIEIRNANFPVYKQVIQAKVGEKLKIQHTFVN
jgi:serine/threonine-protein kinase